MHIGVTGTIGSGKSTVARLLSNALLAEYIDSDQICRQRLEPGEAGLIALQQRTGDRFIAPDGSLHRQLLRQVVFTEPQLRTVLEEILHPLVQEEITRRLAACAAVGSILVVEVPLLFELGWQKKFTCTVVVAGGWEQCLLRASRRDGVDRAEIARILAVQMPVEEKIALADFVVNTSGTYTATVVQTAWLVNYLASLATQATFDAALPMHGSHMEA